MPRPANAKLPASTRSFTSERAPLYRQIFLWLRNKIVDGEFRDGSYLPSELEVASAFGVSRITAKRALNELANAGLAVRQRGRGTRVRYRSGGTMVSGSVQSLLDSLRANARNETRVLELGFVPAPPDVATALHVPAGSPVQRAVRACTQDDLPYSLLTTFVPGSIAKDWSAADLRRDAVFTLLERAGSPIEFVEQTITATLADTDLSALLHVPLGSPLLRVVRTAYSAIRTPVEYLTALYPPDRYQFLMTLTKDADGADWS